MSETKINYKTVWKPFLIASSLAFLYAGVLVKLFNDWWTDENYSHGLLIPFVIGFIVWSESGPLKKAVSEPRIFSGLTVVLTALVMLLAGTLGAELFLQRISLVVLLVGAVVYFFGARILPLLVAPFLLLLFSIPVPQIIFNKIAFPLQLYASQAAVWGIRLLAIPTVRKGNVIEILPQGASSVIALEVVEACSGIRSLMTLVSLALVLAFFTREKTFDAEAGWKGLLKSFDFWRMTALMLAAVPIAVLTNSARVALTGAATFYYGKRALSDFWHDLSGWLVYLAALILLIAVNGILKFLTRRRNDTRAQSNKINGENFEHRSAPGTQHSAPGTRRSVLLLAAVLIAGGVFINWFDRRGEAEITRKPLAEFAEELGSWRQRGREIRFSEATEAVLKTTDYTMREYESSEGRIANLYVGYYASQRTGATYHSPQNCLPGAGWVLSEPALIEIRTPSGKTFAANRYRINNGTHDQLMIYWYQGRGRIEASEYRDKINTVFDSVLRRRSDGAMIRVMIPVAGDAEKAETAARDLAAHAADRLSEFVPE